MSKLLRVRWKKTSSNCRARRLKQTSQLTGIFPPDPELTLPTQELFEQFYEQYGIPNDDEKFLLQNVGGVDLEVIDAWCEYNIHPNTERTQNLVVEAKDLRMRACNKLRKKIRRCLRLCPEYGPSKRARGASRNRPRKPYTRH